MKIANKKYLIVSLILLLGLLYAAIRALGPEESVLYKGIIIHTHSDGFMTLLVDGQFDQIEDSLSTVTEFSLAEGIKVYLNANEVNHNELKRGMYVEIQSSPEIRTSYPAQGTAQEVRVVETENAPLFMEGEVLSVLDHEEGFVSTLHLKGFLEGYGQDTEIYVTIPEGSYYPFGLESNRNIIKNGDRVFVVLTGAVRESYPLQGTSSSVIVVAPTPH